MFEVQSHHTLNLKIYFLTVYDKFLKYIFEFFINYNDIIFRFLNSIFKICGSVIHIPIVCLTLLKLSKK